MSSDRRHTPRRTTIRKWLLHLHWLAGMAALVLMLFFSTTGFLLNHADDLDFVEPVTTKRMIRLPIGTEPMTPERAAIDILRQDKGIRGIPEKPEWKDERIALVFKSPGVRHDILIDPKSGEAEIESEVRGIVGRLMEFHRGKDAGAGWKFAVDAAAVLLALLTLSGFWLWAATPSWRGRGLIGLGASIAALIAAIACSW